MGWLGDVNRIGDIVAHVGEIALEMHRRALHAAGERAWAGEQGRGFAVVAEEAHSLTERAASAARETKRLIQDPAGDVDAGSVLLTRSSPTLTEVARSVTRVTSIVAEMVAASHEQAPNAAQTEELSAMAAALAMQASELRALMARVKIFNEAGVGPSSSLPDRAAPGRSRVASEEPRRAPRGLRATDKRFEPMFESGADNGHGGLDADGFEEF